MSFKVIANNNGFKPCYKWNTFNTFDEQHGYILAIKF